MSFTEVTKTGESMKTHPQTIVTVAYRKKCWLQKGRSVESMCALHPLEHGDGVFTS